MDTDGQAWKMSWDLLGVVAWVSFIGHLLLKLKLEEDHNIIVVMTSVTVVIAIIGVVYGVRKRKIPVISIAALLFNGLMLLIFTNLGWLASH